MNDIDNKDLNMQLEENEKLLYSDEEMNITNKRLIINGVTTSMQAVKSAWIGVKKIPKWPGVLLIIWGLYLFYPFLAYRADYEHGLNYGIMKYPVLKYLITAFGIGYLFVTSKDS